MTVPVHAGIVFVLAACLAGCDASDETAAKAPAPAPAEEPLLEAEAGDPEALPGTLWVAETIAGRPVPEGVRITLIFDGGGGISGQGGCNRYFGSVLTDGPDLTVEGLGSTKMACEGPVMEAESAFFEALQSAERFFMDSSGNLLIRSKDAAEPTRFRPEPLA